MTQAGFTLPLMLAAVALLALALSAAGPLWATSEQRERERELLRVGLLYAQALAAYRDASPGGRQDLPTELHQLTLDARFVGTRRHLRRLYADPMNPGRPWGLLRNRDGRIEGVHSLSEKPPVAQAELVLADRRLPAAQRYADWHFVALDRP